MPVSTRIEPIANDIKLFVSETLAPAAQSAAIAAFARNAIAEADDSNRSILGRVPRRTVTVDGSVGASLEGVRPGGMIIAEWELVSDVMIWIGEMLRERSPRRSGAYRKAHTLFADNVEVPIGAQVPEANEYVFLNPLPYARKIEIGKTNSGRDFTIQVPNRIYERTAKDAQARFGNIAKIKFSYRAADGPGIAAYVPIKRVIVRQKNGRFIAGHSQGDIAGARRERALRVPAIIVTLRGD